MTDIVYSTGDAITALYDTRSSAEAAMQQLRAAGIPDSGISLTAPNQDTGSRGDDEGVFGGLFSSHEDRASYEEGLRRGGCLVVVRGLAASERERAADILESTDAVDFDERENTWRGEGWTGGTDSGTGSRGSETSVPVAEEELRVGKRDRSHGRVRVRSYVREEPVSEDVSLRDEHVEVERRPVDRPVSGDDPFRERSIEAEERSEEAVVSKEARIAEEVSLRKEADTHHETVRDTVRRTEVEVDRDDDTSSRR
jgi:uncharacterized protein (TIGR02271 family)